jgi:hypothetical protein
LEREASQHERIERERKAEFLQKAQFTPAEITFLKSLTDMHDIWGYHNRSNFEGRSHDHSTDLQRYTDPIFRTIDKLISGKEHVEPFFDIYDKLRGCIQIESKKTISFLKEALSLPAFEADLDSLANYRPISFQMKVLVAFANALFDISNGNTAGAYERMLKPRKLFREAMGF